MKSTVRKWDFSHKSSFTKIQPHKDRSFSNLIFAGFPHPGKSWICKILLKILEESWKIRNSPLSDLPTFTKLKFPGIPYSVIYSDSMRSLYA